MNAWRRTWLPFATRTKRLCLPLHQTQQQRTGRRGISKPTTTTQKSCGRWNQNKSPLNTLWHKNLRCLTTGTPVFQDRPHPTICFFRRPLRRGVLKQAKQTCTTNKGFSLKKQFTKVWKPPIKHGIIISKYSWMSCRESSCCWLLFHKAMKGDSLVLSQ